MDTCNNSKASTGHLLSNNHILHQSLMISTQGCTSCLVILLIYLLYHSLRLTLIPSKSTTVIFLVVMLYPCYISASEGKLSPVAVVLSYESLLATSFPVNDFLHSPFNGLYLLLNEANTSKVTW